MAKDYGDYKNQRHHEGRKLTDGLQKAADDGMFFGASPTERKDLRQTKEKKSFKVEDLDLNALDRDAFGAEKKVGETLRLIDMAMGNEPTPAQQTAPKRPPPSQKKRPKKAKRGVRKSLGSTWSGFMARYTREAKPPEGEAFEAAPDYKGEGVVVAKPRRFLERLAVLAAVLTLGGAAASWGGALGETVGSWASAANGLAKDASAEAALRAALSTREALVAVGVSFLWFALGARTLRRPRGSWRAELLRVAVIAGLPTAVGAAFLYWTTAVSGSFAPPEPLARPVVELLAPVSRMGVPAWALGTACLGLLCGSVAGVARLRRPRL